MNAKPEDLLTVSEHFLTMRKEVAQPILRRCAVVWAADRLAAQQNADLARDIQAAAKIREGELQAKVATLMKLVDKLS